MRFQENKASFRLREIDALKLSPEAILPTRTHSTDAGLDLFAIEDLFIPIQSTRRIKTGIAINIPAGYVGKIEDRSGTSMKGLRTGGGVVDTGYSGEVGIVMHNLTNDDKVINENGYFEMGYEVKKGDKVAQILIYKVELPQVVEVTELWNSERADKGFNSSGR